jgi:hypothetical protein
MPAEGDHVRRCRVMTRLAVIILLTLLLPQLASAKRLPSVKVDPVLYEGIRYVAPKMMAAAAISWPGMSDQQKAVGIDSLY